MGDQLEFKVSESLVRPIIESKINSAIIEAMGGHERMIVEMVSAFMSQKVDTEGKLSSYSNTKRVEWLANKLLEDAVKKALENFIESKKDVIASEIGKFFASKKGSSQLIAAIQEGILGSLTTRWTTSINFTHKS